MTEATWIEIARPGRFQDSGGAWHEFSAERLEKMAASYDSAGREAPLVLGHPATDGPAHGWVKALKFNGRKLLAGVACVSDEIKKAVDNGRYKYVSMSLYQDGGLRHVGLLGAVPPAISGLAPVSFSGQV
jgi:phage I-like protein